MIVYSITDRPSFEYAARSLSELKQLQNHPASYLIGNKADLDHLRTVTETEAAKLAASHSVGCCEVSVAENSPALYKAFEKLIFDSRARPTKQRKFSVSKMIGESRVHPSCFRGAAVVMHTLLLFVSPTGTLIGNGAAKQVPVSHGTVVPCHKGELHKSRVMKRRQAFTATGSL